MADPRSEFVDVPISGGVDTRTAPERVAAPKCLEHQDCSMREPGAVTARRPFSAYTRLCVDNRAANVVTPNLESVHALLSDGESLIAVSGEFDGMTRGRAYVYDHNGPHWAATSHAPAFPVVRKKHLVTDDNLIQHQVAIHAQWICVYYRLSGSAAFLHNWMLVSRADGTVRARGAINGMTVSGAPSSPLGCVPRLVAHNDIYFVLLWVDGTALKGAILDTDSPHAGFAAPVTLATTHATALAIDAWGDPLANAGAGESFVFYSVATGTEVKRLTIGGGVLSAAATAIIAGDVADRGIACAGDVRSFHSSIVLVTCNSANGLKVIARNRTSLAAVTNATIDAAQTAVKDIAILTYVEATVWVATIAYDNGTWASFSVDGFTTKFARYNISTGAVVLGGANLEQRGLYLHSKPARAHGYDLFPLARDQSREATLYLFAQQDWDPTVPMSLVTANNTRTFPVARALGFTLGLHRNQHNDVSSTAIVWENDDHKKGDRLYLVAQERNNDLADVFNTKTRGHLSLLEFDFHPDRMHQSCVADGALHVAGSLSRVWEKEALGLRTATNIGEMHRGFVGHVPLHSPRIDSIASSDGAGALTATATYRYRFTFEYKSPTGRVCRGIPSDELVHTLGAGHDTITLTLNATNHQGPNPGMTLYPFANGILAESFKLVIWRTAPNATTGIYFRKATIDWFATTYSDLADAYESQEVLYTSSGELENVPPPPCLALCEWKQRLVALNSETGELWFSKSIIPQEWPGWNEALVLETNVWSSLPVCVTSQGEHLIVWWHDAVGVVVGEPGSDTGAPGSLQLPVLVSEGIGLAEVKSLAETPIGTLFRSARGIYLLGRDLSVRFLGYDVSTIIHSSARSDVPTWVDDDGAAVADNEIVGAYYVPQEDEAHFVLRDARVAALHLPDEQWRTFAIGDVDISVGGL